MALSFSLPMTMRLSVLNNSGSFNRPPSRSLTSNFGNYNTSQALRMKTFSKLGDFTSSLSPAGTTLGNATLANNGQTTTGTETVITRKHFPADFKFGCATSALQTEGSGTEGGRGPATWDSYIQDDATPGIDIAVDSYHRYKEDVQLLKAMGGDTYRFSISWSRILPEGTIDGGINQDGINFYNNFINELVMEWDNSICDTVPLRLARSTGH